MSKLAYSDTMKDLDPMAVRLSSTANSCDLLNEHHLSGLYYKFYDDPGGQLQYKKQWIHNQTIMRFLEELNEHLKANGINVAVLKGSHLLMELYTDIGSRFMSDIDLLVSGDELEVFKKILTELGCTPIETKKFKANDFKSEWCKKYEEIEINIEIHTRLFYHIKKESWNLIPTSYSNLQKLSAEDLFLHLCGHLAFQHSFLKLYWLYDIYFLYLKNKDSYDWVYLKSKALDYKLYRSLQMCLWSLEKHLGVHLSPVLTKMFKLEEKAFWKKNLTAEFLMVPQKNKWRYFFIKHATKDQLSEAFLYDLNWFYHYRIQKFLLKQ